MVNRPKAIGTFAETAVLKQILPYFPAAERLALKGAADEGDIGHCGEFVFEVKGGKQTHSIGDAKLVEWIGEALAEAENRGVGYGVLVTQRKGFGAPRARRWWVHLPADALAEIMGGLWQPPSLVVVQMELGDFLELLADQGYTPSHGAPVTAEPAAPTPLMSVGISDALADPHVAETVQEILDGTTGGQLWTGEIPIIELDENPNPRVAEYAEENCAEG